MFSPYARLLCDGPRGLRRPPKGSLRYSRGAAVTKEKYESVWLALGAFCGDADGKTRIAGF